MLLTSLVAIMYYLNHSRPEPLADTWSYLYVVNRIQAHGQLVNFWRLPGYPLFIVLVYSCLGQGNLAAVSAVQALLFVLATLEIYIIAASILRRASPAFFISLFVGANLSLLSYIKPIMSEALGLWLLVTLALAVTFFLSTMHRWLFWLVTLCMFLLFLTRPEWIYLPVPLLAYLFLVARWHGQARRLLPHMLAALALLYSFLGGYIYLNATQNHFAGLTWIQSINELGKILQYNMQDEAPAQYSGIRYTLDGYVARDIRDPYVILTHQPELAANYAAPAGAFSQSIILHHPFEFLSKSVPPFISSLTELHEESVLQPDGNFAPFLSWLHATSQLLYGVNILFPLCAIVWFFLLAWKRTGYLCLVQQLFAIILVCSYGMLTTTLGAYRGYDYMRIHVPFVPLLILIIGISLFLCLQRIMRKKGTMVRRSEATMVDEKIVARSQLHGKNRILFMLIGIVILASYSWQPAQTQSIPVPTFCHKELDTNMLQGTGVAMLFITIENYGDVAAPATLSVAFATDQPTLSRAYLLLKTPVIPAGTAIWQAVDLPYAPETASYLKPVGPLTITIDPQNPLPVRQGAKVALITACNDPV